MSGNLNRSFSSCCLDHCVLVESLNCCSNVLVKYSHTRGTLSLTGSKLRSQVVIFRTHWSMRGPLIKVRARATCQMGDSNPATFVLSNKYPNSSFMKLSA